MISASSSNMEMAIVLSSAIKIERSHRVRLSRLLDRQYMWELAINHVHYDLNSQYPYVRDFFKWVG